MYKFFLNLYKYKLWVKFYFIRRVIFISNKGFIVNFIYFFLFVVEKIKVWRDKWIL